MLNYLVSILADSMDSSQNKIMTVNEKLQYLPEDWERALVVVAHPDDVEYGTASAVARWTSQGKQVVYLLATKGEAGIDSIEPTKGQAVASPGGN